jgi:hypothetical protein
MLQIAGILNHAINVCDYGELELTARGFIRACRQNEERQAQAFGISLDNQGRAGRRHNHDVPTTQRLLDGLCPIPIAGKPKTVLAIPYRRRQGISCARVPIIGELELERRLSSRTGDLVTVTSVTCATPLSVA